MNLKANLFATTAMAASLLMSVMAPMAAQANDFGADHPRRAEVLRRDARINRQIAYDKGHLHGQFGRLRREDAAIRAQAQADARFNGGYLTHGEQRQLNGEENRLERQVNRDSHGRWNQGGLGHNGQFASQHPRRAEVLGRDAALNRELRSDRGNLDGQFGQLRRQDRNIARQEQFDARRNGGFITPGQEQQLNREENHLQRQINRDTAR